MRLRSYPYGSFWNLKIFFVVALLSFLSYKFLDIQVTKYFSFYQSSIYPIGQFVAGFFNGKFIIVLIFGLTIFSFLISSCKPFVKYLLTLDFLLILGQIFLCIMKVIVGRSRPELLLSDNIYSFHPLSFSRDYLSFPSGHTINIMIIFFYLAVLFPKFRFLLWGLGLVLSFFRVLFLQHFLSDWFLTAYLSGCLITMGLFLIDRISQMSIFDGASRKFSSYLGLKK